jgi:hypothetical protein
MFVNLAVEIARWTSGERQSNAHPATFYAIPHEISCNLARRFPLYGMGASGLPLRVARSGKGNHATEP